MYSLYNKNSIIKIPVTQLLSAIQRLFEYETRVTLIGLITKNSIMIVEFANQLREKGVKVQEAIIESSKLRLRPILVTTLAAVAGALPLVFADGADAAVRNSIGFVIVGGLSIGTIFTIFVIPVIYQTFKKD